VVRGHSRSSAMSPFDRARTTSYSTLIETMCQSINQSIVLIQATRPIRNTHNTNALQTTNIRRKKKETTRNTDNIHNTQMIYRLITYIGLHT